MYYGSVENDSGEDWKDVQLALSTATPSLSAKPPALKTLYASTHDSYSAGRKKDGLSIGGLFGARRSMASREMSNTLYVENEEERQERGNVSAATTEVGK